jgi:hypothetical protein
MELTTKAEPILGKIKGLGGFCVSSFSTLRLRKSSIDFIRISKYNSQQVLGSILARNR